VLFAVVYGFGVLLHDAQQQSQRAAERRFDQRVEISAALTQSVFGALGSASADELGRQFEGPASAMRGRLAKAVKQARGMLGYAAVLDARGEVITSAGAASPRRSVNGARAVLSDVRGTAAGWLIDYGLPFKTRTGKRVFVEGIRVAKLRGFLEDYLARLPNPDGAILVLTDGGGTVLARVTPKQGSAARDSLTRSARVPGTTWRLALQADRGRVIAGSGSSAWIGWILICALGLAVLAGLALGVRVIGSSRRTAAANRALRESEGKLRALVDALEEAVFMHHADGSVELLNASAKKLAGTDAAVVSPEALWPSVTDDGAPMSFDDTPVGRSFARGESQRSVIGVDRPDNQRMWLDVSTRPLTRPGETAPYAVVCSCTDVTERQNLEAHLLDLADRDPLTNLWNRRRFEQDLACQIDRCRRYDERAALVLMDVDGFKQVNDMLGHLAGDEVLCALGEALRARLRSSDRAARLGGDEFALLLLDVDDEQLERLAAALTGRLCAAAAVVQDTIELSISVGTARLGPHTGSVNEALEAADRAMYAAKQSVEGRRPRADAPRPAVASAAEMSSLRALLAAVNARDNYTAMHSREVVTLARAVAHELGLNEAQCMEVEHVALLHDLGKIGIPDAILRKPGPLTGHEQTLMRQHPVVGSVILASMPELAHLALAVHAEHEHWDGGGYPEGLAGDEIPIASRIVLVCDAYHAMTSNRPYRQAMSAAAARDEIRREAGAQFCPYAAAALLEILTPSFAVAASGGE
jgi:diguanylate cyclase (GGDEF)-like protein/PAS domain S-box-containing protein